MQSDLAPIRRRLTTRYAFISSLLLLAFGCGVYLQVAESLGHLMRMQLQQVASAAASQMPLILHELSEYQSESVREQRNELAAIGMLDAQAMTLQDKHIAWLARDLKVISRHGSYEPQSEQLIPVKQRDRNQFIPLADGMAYWRPVYVRHSDSAQAELKGYVLVALSSSSAEAELQRLRNGLLAGGVLAVITAILLSQWMVGSSIKPVREQIERLVRFTADASHELRHPLTAIRAVIGSVRQRGLLHHADSALAEKFDLVDRATAQMTGLVDDLLLLARLDRSMSDNGHWINFDLAELVDDVLDLHREHARIQELELVDDMMRPALVRGDPERLRQVLNNLLANALRFAPRSSRVWVDLVRTGKWIQLAVEDEGPGIPEDQHHLVFERFWQADHARRGSHFGLGLALVLAIVHSHGGRVDVLRGRTGGCRMLVELSAA